MKASPVMVRWSNVAALAAVAGVLSLADACVPRRKSLQWARLVNDAEIKEITVE